jgi:flagella basal body P-ring formation protein FlgA
LRNAADLPGTRYTLGDIADIATTDAALKERLASISIGAVPRQGYADTISRAQVETLVRQQVSPATIEWRGAAVVKVRGRGQRLETDKLADVAAQALFVELNKEFEAITMQPLRGSQGMNVPAGMVRLTARVPLLQPVTRRMSALVDVSIDGEVYTTVPVWFAVHASRPALLARSSLRTGDALRGEDFQVEMVDVAATGAPALAADAAIAQMRLRRGIEPGTVLRAAHVEARPSVARDQEVVVQVVNGTVTIETRGRALSDARIGDLVKVRSTSTSEAYSARVISDGVVLVSAR